MKIFNYYSNVMEYHQILSYMAQKNELKAIYVGSWKISLSFNWSPK